MKPVIQILCEKVSAAFTKCGYSDDLGSVTLSNRPDLCQFQCNGAFTAAKLYKKSPTVIAAEIADMLSDDNIIKSISVVGAGFINIDLTDEFILSYVKELLDDEHLGIQQSEKQETIFLDYGGPNTAKPLHVGHLRAAVIGESLKRIAEATGRKTVSDVHLGDWGLQIGLIIAELEEKYGSTLAVKIPSADKLNEIYPYAAAKSKTDENFRIKAQNITAALHKGNPEYVSLWKKIMDVSLPDIKANYDLLNVSFDLWYGESRAEKYVDELTDILNSKGLLKESMGAQVVYVSEESDKTEIPPVIIKKSNGGNIYATMDLATILEREKNFHPNEIWYIVDNRQSLYLTQVFRCAKKAELVPSTTDLLHLGFGTMNGKDGKPYKTRDGGVMKLSELFNTVYSAVYEKVSASAHSADSNKQDIARKIAVASIKFGDLINYRSKDYIFDTDKFISSEGKTGSFLLYTIARINSVLKKTEHIMHENEWHIYSQQERDLYLKLALSNSIFISAYNEKAPNLICENAYQIASHFSKFYYDNHIINENDEVKKASWINLCIASRKVLLKHLDVLGIEPVDNM